MLSDASPRAETAPGADPLGADPSIPATDGAGSDLSWLFRWESALIVALGAALIYGAFTPNFFTGTNAFFIGLNMGEVAIMALPLTLIVITGEIDLSVASMLGLSSTLLGYLFKHGWPIGLAILAVLIVGIIGGALNGVLITRLGLPSIAVTIGTLTLFRGVAEGILGAKSVGGYPASLTKIGVVPIAGTQIAYSVGFFAILAIIYGVVLHGMPLGRSIFAIGQQSEAAHFSGIRVKRIKCSLYILSGLVCSFAGVLWTMRFATSRYDAGTGLELNVVAIVLFGGVSIFGGRGSIFGVIIAAAVMGCLQQAMTLHHIDPQVRNIVTGVLLLVSVVVPNIAEGIRRLRARGRRRQQSSLLVRGAQSTQTTIPVRTTPPQPHEG